MNIPENKIVPVREIIRTLYTHPCTSKSLDHALGMIVSLVNADYGTVLLQPAGKRRTSIFLSNNPPGFNDLYLSVVHEDFLLKSMLENRGSYVMRQDPWMDIPEHQQFIETVQGFRPISDIIYMPTLIDSYFNGYWAIARAGLSSPYYSSTEVDLFNFVAPFFNDALKNSLMIGDPPESAAWLDYRGNVVLANPRFLAAIDDSPSWERESLPSLRRAYRRFLHGPLAPGMDRIVLESGGKRRSFRFRLLPCAELRPKAPDVPFASVEITCLEDPGPRELSADIILGNFNLTPRETQVVRELSRGLSNKIIAQTLGVDESTIKRHTHNIYEKTGFKSRMELLLGLKANR